MTHLLQEQRAELAKLIESRLADLKQTNASHLQGQTQTDTAHQNLLQDSEDARQQAGEHEVESVISDIESKEFNGLRDAFERIRGPCYGLCTDCNAAIPFARLQVEPQALRCTACCEVPTCLDSRMSGDVNGRTGT